jgi:hypothetical protein
MVYLLEKSVLGVTLVAEEACERIGELVRAENLPLPSGLHRHDGEVYWIDALANYSKSPN